VTPFVANYLLRITGATDESIIMSTSGMKKEVIGAFKSLTSFYAINLGYSIEDAVYKAESHFRRHDALAIHKTLQKGAKEVFSLMQESGYGLKESRTLCEFMINSGSTLSSAYSRGLPDFLKLIGKYGPNGKKVMEFALDNENFFDLMALPWTSYCLLKVSQSEPLQPILVMSELTKYDWKNPTFTKEKLTGADDLFEDVEIMSNLTFNEKAQLVALGIYMSKLDKDTYETRIEKKGWSFGFGIKYNGQKAYKRAQELGLSISDTVRKFRYDMQHLNDPEPTMSTVRTILPSSIEESEDSDLLLPPPVRDEAFELPEVPSFSDGPPLPPGFK
jgi:hypothetical protein